MREKTDCETILEEADRLVSTDRQQDYGHPLDDFAKTAKIWSAILGVDVTPEQVGLCMVGVKISRECNRPKRDNRVDGAGYFKTVDMIHNERERREEEECSEMMRGYRDFDVENVKEPDLDHCPNCGGPADNGHDRSVPPSPYFCTKCSEAFTGDPDEFYARRFRGADSYDIRVPDCSHQKAG